MTCDRVCYAPADICPAAPFCGALNNLPPEPDPEQAPLWEEERVNPHDTLVSVIHEALHELDWLDAEQVARAIERHHDLTLTPRTEP